jgi:hypothetical protein
MFTISAAGEKSMWNIYYMCLHMKHGKRPMWTMSAMPVSCWQVGSLCGFLYLSALLASKLTFERCLLYM